jgi:hypothetical protein
VAAVFSVKADARKSVYCLVAGVAVVFSNTDHSISISIHDSVRISHVDLRSNRFGLSSTAQLVDSLVNEVREVDNVVGNDIAPTSIFVHGCSGIERGWDNLHNSSVCGLFHYGEASLFFWAKLSPVDLAAFNLDFG